MVRAKRFEKLNDTFSRILDRKIIISLFDFSGVWPYYYSKAGFRVLQVDLKLGIDIFNFEFKKIEKELVFGIMVAPPCTDFAVSGAQYWSEKDENGSTEKSVRLVRRALEIVKYFDPVFWALENPVGRLPKLIPELGKPWYFQPYNFGNRWSKKTGLWGQFNKPKRKSVKPLKFSGQGSWTQLLGGKSERTKELRSITPIGFAKEFYKSNHRIVTRKMKQMVTYEHKDFVETNKLSKSDFSAPLQKKMELFDQMCSNLKDTFGEDRERMKSLIEELDREIGEDMEEEYAGRIENNDLESNDEDILENLYDQGKRTIKLSELRKIGFKSDLENRRYLILGKYSLERISTFTYSYEINRV